MLKEAQHIGDEGGREGRVKLGRREEGRVRCIDGRDVLKEFESEERDFLGQCEVSGYGGLAKSD